MILLLGFAFLSGLVTILAPCIWPLLPIVLSTSISGSGKRRPLGITIGIMTSFTVFTLAISTIVSLFHLDPNILRIVAVVVIFILGLTMLIPQLSVLFELAVGRLTGALGSGQNNKTGFLGGFVTGFTLGIIWSPCAGPILASIAALAATGQVTLSVIAVTLAYVTGVGIPLFFFAYGGQQIVLRTRGISKYTGTIQRIFGVVMILASVLIYTNYDKQIQASVLNQFPILDSALNGFEKSEAVQSQLEALKGNMPAKNNSANKNELFNVNVKAPELSGITQWLNPNQPLTLNELKGKVVLVDFWTYTCINCIRTLPYVTSWYDKYHDKGFVVIGIHTPEFAFEKDTNNVLKAITQFNIHYPVAQDNNYGTWEAFNNQYWPAEYLIDAKGVIRRTHFGEGEYDKMEHAIQLLLAEAGQASDMPLVSLPDQTPNSAISPESYIGATRMQYEWPNGSVQEGEQTFVPATIFPVNSFSFGGTWNISGSYSTASNISTLSYHFRSSKVFLVMKPESESAKVKVTVDGQNANGSDVKDGFVTVDSDRLYELVNTSGKASEHTVKLEFGDGRIQVYAFTFG